MALWQYHCPIVPNVDFLSERLKILRNEDGFFEDDILWNEYQAPKSLFNPIDKLLEKGQSWSKNIELYGHQEHDCIEIFGTGEAIASVSFRIDFTSDYTNLLEQVIEFCIYEGLTILDDQYDILPMNVLSIKSFIESSDQFRKLYRLAGK